MGDLLEIYSAASAIEGARIVALLAEDGIDAWARETTMASFPSPSGASVLILVAAERADAASHLIAVAVRDGAISALGASLR